MAKKGVLVPQATRGLGRPSGVAHKSGLSDIVLGSRLTAESPSPRFACNDLL
jgi:hypothetical protein